jgi:hypothetical protein
MVLSGVKQNFNQNILSESELLTEFKNVQNNCCFEVWWSVKHIIS